MCRSYGVILSGGTAISTVQYAVYLHSYYMNFHLGEVELNI